MRSLDLENEKSLIIELISNEIISNKFLIDDYNSMQKAYLSLDNNEYSLSIYYPDKILFCSNSGFDIKNHAEQIILSKINKIVGKYESLDYLKLYVKVSSDTSSFLQVYKGNNVLWNDNDNILSVDTKQLCHYAYQALSQTDEYKNGISDEESFIEHELSNINECNQITYCLIFDNQCLACASLVGMRNENSCILVGVATPPINRNKGYSTKVVSKLCNDISQKGKTVYLFYNNPAAGRVYKKVGFVDVAKWRVLIM